MRVGLSWDLEGDDAGAAWQHVADEAVVADGLGYDSIWVSESREDVTSCPSPVLWLTNLARQTNSLQLRATRRVTRANPVRVAEEVAVLDVFSRGRAGLAFTAASDQGVPAAQVHETLDFVTHAWAVDEFRYRGDFVRFPSHTPDDAPAGVTTPEPGGTYVPQWDWGPDTPDFLAITPKPYSTRPPTYAEIADDETLVWAAKRGVSPLVAAETPTAEAIERLARYREIADAEGRIRAEVEPVLERRIVMDDRGDEYRVGGGSSELIDEIRALAAQTAISHLVWRRGSPADGDLLRFAGEVQPMLQA
ncbi:MAG: LLM class flavin-dependent oxidoreductase [Acidimicrobiia bacterium]